MIDLRDGYTKISLLNEQLENLARNNKKLQKDKQQKIGEIKALKEQNRRLENAVNSQKESQHRQSFAGQIPSSLNEAGFEIISSSRLKV